MINLPKQRPSKPDIPTDIVLNFTMSFVKKFYGLLTVHPCIVFSNEAN